MNNSSEKKGYSLIEALTYTAVLSVLLLVAIGTFITMARTYNYLKTTKAINSSAISSFNRMVTEIRGAYDIDLSSSVLNTDPGYLTLKTKNASSTEVVKEFYLEGNKLTLKQGGIVEGTFTESPAIISHLIFRNVSGSTSKAVSIEMTVEATLGTTTRSVTLYDSAVLRNSYQGN